MLPVLFERGGVLLQAYLESASEQCHAASPVGEGWRAVVGAFRGC